eukprot:jgi/Bigna1/86655/estExt_fgenesh1_pg.C_120151
MFLEMMDGIKSTSGLVRQYNIYTFDLESTAEGQRTFGKFTEDLKWKVNKFKEFLKMYPKHISTGRDELLEYGFLARLRSFDKGLSLDIFNALYVLVQESLRSFNFNMDQILGALEKYITFVDWDIFKDKSLMFIGFCKKLLQKIDENGKNMDELSRKNFDQVQSIFKLLQKVLLVVQYLQEKLWTNKTLKPGLYEELQKLVRDLFKKEYTKKGAFFPFRYHVDCLTQILKRMRDKKTAVDKAVKTGTRIFWGMAGVVQLAHPLVNFRIDARSFKEGWKSLKKAFRLKNGPQKEWFGMIDNLRIAALVLLRKSRDADFHRLTKTVTTDRKATIDRDNRSIISADKAESLFQLACDAILERLQQECKVSNGNDKDHRHIYYGAINLIIDTERASEEAGRDNAWILRLCLNQLSAFIESYNAFTKRQHTKASKKSESNPGGRLDSLLQIAIQAQCEMTTKQTRLEYFPPVSASTSSPIFDKLLKPHLDNARRNNAEIALNEYKAFTETYSRQGMDLMACFSDVESQLYEGLTSTITDQMCVLRGDFEARRKELLHDFAWVIDTKLQERDASLEEIIKSSHEHSTEKVIRKVKDVGEALGKGQKKIHDDVKRIQVKVENVAEKIVNVGEKVEKLLGISTKNADKERDPLMKDIRSVEQLVAAINNANKSEGKHRNSLNIYFFYARAFVYQFVLLPPTTLHIGHIMEYAQLAKMKVQPNANGGYQKVFVDIYFDSWVAKISAAIDSPHAAVRIVRGFRCVLEVIDVRPYFRGDPSPLKKAGELLLRLLPESSDDFTRSTFQTHRPTLLALSLVLKNIAAVAPGDKFSQLHVHEQQEAKGFFACLSRKLKKMEKSRHWEFIARSIELRRRMRLMSKQLTGLESLRLGMLSLSKMYNGALDFMNLSEVEEGLRGLGVLASGGDENRWSGFKPWITIASIPQKMWNCLVRIPGELLDFLKYAAILVQLGNISNLEIDAVEGGKKCSEALKKIQRRCCEEIVNMTKKAVDEIDIDVTKPLKITALRKVQESWERLVRLGTRVEQKVKDEVWKSILSKLSKLKPKFFSKWLNELNSIRRWWDDILREPSKKGVSLFNLVEKLALSKAFEKSPLAYSHSYDDSDDLFIKCEGDTPQAEIKAAFKPIGLMKQPSQTMSLGFDGIGKTPTNTKRGKSSGERPNNESERAISACDVGKEETEESSIDLPKFLIELGIGFIPFVGPGFFIVQNMQNDVYGLRALQHSIRYAAKARAAKGFFKPKFLKAAAETLTDARIIKGTATVVKNCLTSPSSAKTKKTATFNDPLVINEAASSKEILDSSASDKEVVELEIPDIKALSEVYDWNSVLHSRSVIQALVAPFDTPDFPKLQKKKILLEDVVDKTELTALAFVPDLRHLESPCIRKLRTLEEHTTRKQLQVIWVPAGKQQKSVLRTEKDDDDTKEMQKQDEEKGRTGEGNGKGTHVPENATRKTMKKKKRKKKIRKMKKEIRKEGKHEEEKKDGDQTIRTNKVEDGKKRIAAKKTERWYVLNIADKDVSRLKESFQLTESNSHNVVFISREKGVLREGVMEECYENQRFYLSTGWDRKLFSTDPFPYGDTNEEYQPKFLDNLYLKRLSDQNINMPKWRWASKLLKERWEYAFDFPNSRFPYNFYPSPRQCFVRRRLRKRLRERVDTKWLSLVRDTSSAHEGVAVAFKHLQNLRSDRLIFIS